MATEPYEIISGPADVWIADRNAVFPDVDELPSVIGGGSVWHPLGQTEGGVTVRHTQTMKSIPGDNRNVPIKYYREDEGFEVEFALAELTLANYQYAIDNPIGTLGPPNAAARSLDLYRGGTVTEHALLVRGPSPYDDLVLQYEVPQVVQTDEPEVEFTRDDKAVLVCTFEVVTTPGEDPDFGRIVAAITPYADEVVNDGPWGYWKMDEASSDPQDSSGNARHLTAEGGLTYEKAIDLVSLPGLGNESIEGNGSNGVCYRVGAGDPAALTFEGWLQVNEPVTTSIAPMLTNGRPTHDLNGSGVFIDNAAGKFQVYANGAATTCESDAAAAQGVWYHLVVTYNGTTWRMYINGVLQAATATVNPGSPTNDVINTMGVRSQSVLFHSKMRVAHLAFYTSALSETRIRAHYDAATI